MRFSLKEKLQKISKKNLIFLIFASITILSIGIFLPLKIAQGQFENFFSTLMDAILEGIMTVTWMVVLTGTIIGLSNVLLGLGAAFFNWAVNLNLNILLTRCNPGDACIVDAGWAFARDLANMFFILALVFIAFATILGIESYGMRKMLLPLILIALVINFSQLFLGIIVDFASVFMQVFAEPLLNWVQIVAQSVLAQFMIFVNLAWGLFNSALSLICPPCAIVATDPLTTITVFFAKILFVTAYNILSGIMFLILGGVFLLRVPMIWVLTIIAPMGLVCYLFPFLRDKYNWWIKQVGQWVFIGVFALFFSYLASMLWRIVWGPNWALTWQASDFGTGFLIGDLGPWFVKYILPGVVYLLFLFIGLNFAGKSSAIFAGAIIGGVAAFGKQIQGRIQGTMKKWPRERAAEDVQRWRPGALERRADLVKRIPVVGRRWEAQLRERDYAMRTGRIGAGGKEAEKIQNAEDVGYAIAKRQGGRDKFGSTWFSIGAAAEMHEKGGKEGEKVRAGMRRAGWSNDRIARWYDDALLLTRDKSPKTFKALRKYDMRVASLPVSQEEYKVATRWSQYMTPAEKTALGPRYGEVVAERIWAESVNTDMSIPEKQPHKSLNYRHQRDAVLRSAKAQALRRYASRNPKAAEKLQTEINRLIRSGAITQDEYKNLYNTVTDKRARRNLKLSGMDKIKDKVPWICPVCGTWNSRNNTGKCVHRDASGAQCSGKRPW